MRRPALQAVPWLLAVLFAGTTAFASLAGGAFRPDEIHRVEAAPVVMAIRRIAQLSTVEVQVADVVRYEEVKTFLIFDFPRAPRCGCAAASSEASTSESQEFAGEWPNVSARVLRVRMPRPRLLAARSAFRVVREESGWINPISPRIGPLDVVGPRAARAAPPGTSGIEAKAHGTRPGADHVAPPRPSGWERQIAWRRLEGLDPPRVSLPGTLVQFGPALFDRPDAEVAPPGERGQGRQDEFDLRAARARDPQHLQAQELAPRREPAPGRDLLDPLRRARDRFAEEPENRSESAVRPSTPGSRRYRPVTRSALVRSLKLSPSRRMAACARRSWALLSRARGTRMSPTSATTAAMSPQGRSVNAGTSSGSGCSR